MYYDPVAYQCRRRSPRVDVTLESLRWPRAHKDNWCGEYLGQDGIAFGSEAWGERTKKAGIDPNWIEKDQTSGGSQAEAGPPLKHEMAPLVSGVGGTARRGVGRAVYGQDDGSQGPTPPDSHELGQPLRGKSTREAESELFDHIIGDTTMLEWTP